MRSRPLLHPAAKQEIRDAIFWYESRRVGLGRELMAKVRAALQKIQEHPRSGQRFPGKEGTALALQIGKFPYRMIYEQRGDAMFVVAFAHYRRRPGYWSRR